MEGKKIYHIEKNVINSMPRVWRNAEAARKAGYEVVVIGHGENCEYNGMSYLGVGYPCGRINRVFGLSKKMVNLAIKGKPDIVELHSPEFLLYALRIHRKGIKVLFNSHEIYSQQILVRDYIPKGIRKIISNAYILFERFVCKRIEGLIYPCTVDGKNVFEKQSNNPIKIENYPMIYMGEKSEVIDKSIIYAGALSENRGITTLVNVANKIDCQLFLAGEYDSPEYEKYINKLAKKGTLNYMGVLSREELMKLYSAMCVGVSVLKKKGQYSHIDNLSTKIYEFMQCGLPVVCTEFDYARRVNEKYEFGYTVDPDDEEAIALLITKLFDDKDLSSRLGENGKRAIRDDFNWEIEANRLVEYYDKILEENR